jgi:hypothetical protein
MRRKHGTQGCDQVRAAEQEHGEGESWAFQNRRLHGEGEVLSWPDAENKEMIVTAAEPIDLSKSNLVRSTGLHASAIYGNLYKHLEPERFGKPGEPQEPNDELMFLGSALEDRLEPTMQLNGISCYRPGEFIHTTPDGQQIAFSPDLMIFNGVTRVGEIKLTSMKVEDLLDLKGAINNLPPKMDKYLTQMMLYIKWLELRHGWLGIMSIYRPYAPVFVPLNIEFSDRDLDDNERMCLNHARHEGLLK